MTTTTKRCYICDREIAVEEATRIANAINDAMSEGECADDNCRTCKWVDENLTHCQGPPENFLDDEVGRVVVCETCWTSL